MVENRQGQGALKSLALHVKQQSSPYKCMHASFEDKEAQTTAIVCSPPNLNKQKK